MLFKKKRGQRPLYAVAELVIGVLLLSLFIYRAVDLGTDAGTQKVYLANDLALTANTLHAIAGNLVYDYREDVRPYVFEIGEGTVRVATPSRIPSWYTGYYADKQEHPIARRLTTPPIISFAKAGSVITISTERQSLGRTACPNADTGATLRELDIVIDPGQSSADPGEQFVEYSEYQVTRHIAQALQSICSNCRVLQQGTIDERIAAIGDADLIVSLHIGGRSNANGVLASHRIDDVASEKLGCLLANSMVRLEFLGQARTTPVDLSRVDPSDARRILSDTIPSAQFVIGSIEVPNPLADTEGTVRLATKIYEGLQEYTSGEAAPVTERSIFTIPRSCENPRRGSAHERTYEITDDIIERAESVGRRHGIPAAALVAIAIHESGLNLEGTLGKPCPKEDERDTFHPGQVTQRLFIERMTNSLTLTCAQQRESGDDRLVPIDLARREGTSCESHSCVWRQREVSIACEGSVRRDVPVFVCLAEYETIRDAFEDWAQGYERLRGASNCGATPTTLNGFIDHAACVFYDNDEQWKNRIHSLVTQYCLEAST